MAVDALQLRVVDAFDAGLPDHGADFQARELRAAQLRFLDLSHIAEQMRSHAIIGIFARRHFLDQHLGQARVAGALTATTCGSVACSTIGIGRNGGSRREMAR